jgi:hypothetical protein
MSLSDKRYFFGGAQLVLLTARSVEPPGALPCQWLRLPARPFDGPPWRGLDTGGWRLQWEGPEQDKPPGNLLAFRSRCSGRWGVVGPKGNFLSRARLGRAYLLQQLAPSPTSLSFPARNLKAVA